MLDRISINCAHSNLTSASTPGDNPKGDTVTAATATEGAEATCATVSGRESETEDPAFTSVLPDNAAAAADDDDDDDDDGGGARSIEETGAPAQYEPQHDTPSTHNTT